MKELEVSLHRLNNTRVVKANLSLYYESDKYDTCELSFMSNDKPLSILSTTSGRIENDVVISYNMSQSEIFVEYLGDSKIECLVGYYKGDNLDYSITLDSVIEYDREIKEVAINSPVISTVSKEFNERLSDFKKHLKKTSSLWKFDLSCPNDVVLSPVTKGKDKIIIAFGEVSEEMLASDYFFSVDANAKVVNIPKEIFELKHPQYSSGCKIGVFELVKPDFINVDNVYFKVLISNTLSLVDFVR